MRLTFYIYWVWYIIITLFLLSGIKLNPEYSKLLTCAQQLSQILLVVIPMYIVYIMQERLETLEMKYFEGCMVSFILRGMTFMMGVYDIDDRYLISYFYFVMLSLWFAFKARRTIRELINTMLIKVRNI